VGEDDGRTAGEDEGAPAGIGRRWITRAGAHESWEQRHGEAGDAYSAHLPIHENQWKHRTRESTKANESRT
jgi:hypothetical protein